MLVYSASLPAHIYLIAIGELRACITNQLSAGVTQVGVQFTIIIICPLVHQVGKPLISRLPLPNKELLFTVLMLVPLTNVGCTAISPLQSRLVEFTVFMFVHDTNVG